MSNQYTAYSPDMPRFDGARHGVTFANGRAVVDINTIEGDDVEEVVKLLEADGFICEVVKDTHTGLNVELDDETGEIVPSDAGTHEPRGRDQVETEGAVEEKPRSRFSRSGSRSNKPAE